MIKIFIFGITGKIGKLILNYIKQNKNFIITGGINKNNLKKLINNKYNLIFYYMKYLGVLVDFSNPTLLKIILFITRYYNIPLLIGSTGYNLLELKFIKFFSLYSVILISYNMSIGINLLNFIFTNLNYFLYKYNFNSIIIDIHHNKKKDMPSGTSLILASKLKNVNINIISIRIKKILGNHIIYVISNFELLKFEHYIINNNIFIIGVFYSIIWLLINKKGCYSMYDVYFKC